MARLSVAAILPVLLVVVATGREARAGLADLNGDGHVRVVCMGDSNTASNERFAAAAGWCSILGRRFGRSNWTAVERGRSGSAAACGLKAFGRSLPCLRDALPDVLRGDTPDAIILAYGTNDVLYGTKLDQAVGALRAAVEVAEAEGIPVWVAYVPPLAGPAAAGESRVAEINRRIRSSFERTIDFHSPMRFPEDYWEDGIHIDGILHAGATGPTGQEKRAQAALAALESARGARDGSPPSRGGGPP